MKRIGLGMWAIGAFAVLTLVLLRGQPAGGTSHLEKELVIVATGGQFERLLKEHFYEPFTKATGVKITPVATAGTTEQFAKLKAMGQAGKVEWDVVSTGEASLLLDAEFLTKLDCNAIPNAGKFGLPGTCRDYDLLRTIGGGVLAYNTKAFSEAPRSYVDFWDVKRFPGPRALPNAGFPWWVLGVALYADGVPPDKLVPMDLDRAFRKLDQIKPLVKVWWKSGDQSQQIMRGGEAVMAMMWSGRAVSLKKAGVPIDIVWKGAPRDVAGWGIAKGAPHPKAALAFLDFFMERPEAHLAFSLAMNYDTANRVALDLVPPAERASRALQLENWNNMIDVDGHPWVHENRARIVERWNSWVAQ